MFENATIVKWYESEIASSCIFCGKTIKANESLITIYFPKARHTEWIEFHIDCFQQFDNLMKNFNEKGE